MKGAPQFLHAQICAVRSSLTKGVNKCSASVHVDIVARRNDAKLGVSLHKKALHWTICRQSHLFQHNVIHSAVYLHEK
jgi:hypothetical protein